MEHLKSPLVIVLILLVVGEGLYITYPSWSPLLSVFTRPSETATSTDEGSVSAIGPKSIEENGKYYDISTSYPGETPLKKTAGALADQRAVSAIKGFEQNTIESFKENGNFANLTAEDIKIQGLDQGRKYTLTIDYKLYTSPMTISYVLDIYEDTLGAHGNGFYRTFTFDSATGAGVLFGDLFTPNSDYLGKISSLARAKLPAIIAKAEGVSISQVDMQAINDGASADGDNFQSFYLDGKTLVILFPPYQVAAYAAGPQTLRIPLSDLKAILKTKYQ